MLLVYLVIHESIRKVQLNGTSVYNIEVKIRIQNSEVNTSSELSHID